MSTAHWSPLLLGRYGGLPVEAVPGSSDDTQELLADAARRREALDAEAPALLDGLYAVVPVVDDVAVRRRVLRAKRRIFAGRATGLTEEDLAVLAAAAVAAPGALAEACRSWDTRVGGLAATVDALREAVEAQESALRDALAATLEDEDHLSSLAVAAPDFVRAHLGGHTDLGSLRSLRTLLQYASRAARKTSPFAGLTTVAEPGRPSRGRRRASVAHHLAWAAVEGAAAQGSDSPFAVTTAPVLDASAGGHDRLLISSRRHFADDVVYREDTVTGARHAVTALASCPPPRADGHSPVAVVDTLHDAEVADPETRYRRLVASGLVRPVVPWARGDDPFVALAKHWRDGTAGLGARSFERATEVAERLPGAGAETRIEELGAVAHLADAVLSPRERTSGRTGLVYEDREATLAEEGPLGLDPVREDLDRLAAEVDPWVFRSHRYDLMVRRFVARHGAGGATADPLGFLAALALDGDGDPEDDRATRADLAADETTRLARREGGGRSAVRRHLAAYVQLVGRDRDALARGEGLTVVNMFGSGNGALQARFTRLLGDDFADRVREHVRSLWDTDEVLEWQAWTECNTGQASCVGVLPELGLPGETRSGRGTDLSELRLVHREADDTLELTRGDAPVGVAYLGLTPQHLLPAHYRWLGVLSDPWVRVPPVSDHSQRMQRLGAPVADGVLHLPRRQVGRLVTRREAWELDAPTVRALLDEPDDLALLRRVHDLAQRHDLPREVFAHQQSASLRSQHAMKPVHVDLGSPLSLRVLAKGLAADLGRLRLVEALPARGQHPVVDASGRPTVSEHVLNLSWEDHA